MQPLIQELQSLYQGVTLQLNVDDPSQFTQVSGVLGLVSADWPATSDFLGFAHSASLSHCTKCESRLPSSASKHEPAFFELHQARSRSMHVKHGQKWLQQDTESKRDEYLSRYGYRQCSLLQLPYFSPGNDHAVDWMHSAFMGTCKDIFEQLKTHHYLTAQSFATMEARSRRLKLPTNIGRICHKLHANMSQLKADQARTHTITTPTMQF
jgi:hypothetical protein